MKKFTTCLVVAAGMACSGPALANGVAVEANVARAQSEWGAELGIGYNLSLGGFTLRPMGGALIYKGDNDRYEEDTFSNNQTRCRDNTNGQFVDDDKCDNTAVKPYAKIEATYTLPGSIEFGAGARFSSEKMRPYATLSTPIAPKIRLRANGGKKYYALGLRADF